MKEQKIQSHSLSQHDGLLMLNAIFVAVLVTSNFLSSRMAEVFCFHIPAGTLGYAITFLITDIIGEKYGKKESKKTVAWGFLSLIVCIALSQISIWLPSDTNDEAYRKIFGSTIRVITGSLCGYVVSQISDIVIFHKIKLFTNGQYKFIRNNVATIISQSIDTTIFMLVAFSGIVPNIWSAIFDLIIVKIGLAILDTPLFYLFTKEKKSN